MTVPVNEAFGVKVTTPVDVFTEYEPSAVVRVVCEHEGGVCVGDTPQNRTVEAVNVEPLAALSLLKTLIV